MRTLMTMIVLGGMLSGLLPKLGRNPMTERFPLEGEGDIHFQADASRFLEDGHAVIDISLAIPESDLGGYRDSSRLQASVEVLDRKGKPRGAFGTFLNLPPGAPPPPGERTFPVARRWIRLTAPWREDCFGVRVKLEDTERNKQGLLDRVRGKPLAGEAMGRVVDLGGPGGLGWLSDLLFVWGATSADGAAPAGGGLRPVRGRLEPNPYRYYGLYQPVVAVYWEQYVPDGQVSPPLLVSETRLIRLSDSLVVHVQAESLSGASTPQWKLKRFDISGLDAGSYACEVELRDPAAGGKGVLGRTRGDFSVVWERNNWTLERSDLVALGRVILPAKDFEQFALLDRGGMETYLRGLWNRLAPAASGDPNPLEEKALARVRYAQQNFRGVRPGLLSDRGIIYVRFGPPDEITKELNPQDQKLLWIVMPQQVDAEGTEDLSALERKSKPRTPQDNRAYEIWEYSMHGDPLLPEYLNPGQKMEMKYIFVDEQGTGDYTLAYSNVPSGLR